MPVCEIDLEVGGCIRYVWRHTSGSEMGLTGTFREIKPDERLVHTEVFDEDWTGGETRVTTIFAETAADTTTVRILVLYASTEARDAASRSGMEGGVAASYDRLDAILVQAATATRVVEVPIQTAMVVRKTIPMADMRSAQQAARAALAAAGLGEAGPRLTIGVRRNRAASTTRQAASSRNPSQGREKSKRWTSRPVAPRIYVSSVATKACPAPGAASSRIAGGTDGLRPVSIGRSMTTRTPRP